MMADDKAFNATFVAFVVGRLLALLFLSVAR